MPELSALAAYLRASFLKLLAYRLRYVTGIITYSLYVAVNSYLWKALYLNRETTVEGYDAREMVTYVSVAWIARSFYFNNVDNEVAERVRSGAISLDLLRPVPLPFVYLSQAFGEGLFRSLFFTLPMSLVLFPVFGISGPASPLHGVAFAVSLVLAFIVNVQVNLLAGLVSVFAEQGTGVGTVKTVLVNLTSGLLVPLEMFPKAVQHICDWLPFRTIAHIPLAIYLGRAQHDEILYSLGIQAAWALGLGILLVLVWSRSVRHLVLQGG